VKRTAALLVLAWVLPGCGGSPPGAFVPRFPANNPSLTGAVTAALPPPRTADGVANATGRPLVVAVTAGDEAGLLAFDIEAERVLWRRELDTGSRPEILGDVVLCVSGGRLHALDTASGKGLWHRRIGTPLYLGAARSGEVVVYATAADSPGGESGVSFVTAVAARDGKPLWQRQTRGRLGRPAAVSDLAFVPWDGQSLVALDLEDGTERARLRAGDDVIRWVRAGVSGVYFGDRNLYRLGSEGYDGTRDGAPHLRAPLREAPAGPPLDGGALPDLPGGPSARGEIRVHFETAGVPDDRVALVDDRFYLVFHRYILGLDQRGNPAWARMFSDNAVGGRAVPGGLAAVFANGELRLLDAVDGRERRTARMPARLRAAAVDAAGIGPGPGEAGPPVPLREALFRMALDPDNRLVAARVYAIEQLARMPDPEVTRDLLDLYTDPTLAPYLRKRILRALRERKSGSNYLIDALLERYDFVAGTETPPLSAIVPAVVALGERRALPHLLRHLGDHETPAAELPAVVEGIAALGDRKAAAALLSFVRLYRADSSFRGAVAPLLLAARGVLRHGGEAGRELLSRIAGQRGTLPGLSAGIRKLLEKERQGKTDAAFRVGEKAKAPLPERLGQREIRAAISGHIDGLRACIIEELGRNASVRLVRLAFVIDNDGRPHGLRFVPGTPEFVDCMAPRVRRIRFPRFRAARQLGSYTIYLKKQPAGAGGGEAAPGRAGGLPSPYHAERTAATTREPFWAAAKRRAEQEGREAPAAARPWWMRPGRAARAGGETTPGGREAGAAPSVAPASETVVEDTWWLPAEEE
jgi:outer membrane protein assembly factor BamB